MPALLAGWLALGLPLLAGPPAALAAEPETLTGKLMLLPEALKALGVTADAAPVAGQVVLKGDDGTITPLLCDDASRAVFKDERLRHRRAELKAKRHAGLPYVQVLVFRVEYEGTLRTPEYYCEICSISVRFPQECPCCQGPMELRFRADSP